MEPIKVIPLSEMYTAVWGKQGENNAVQLSYDLTGWENVWPNGGAAVSFRRADGKEYAHEFVREGNTLLIPVKAYDTEIFGSCAVVISWIDNGSEARSVIINGRVNESIVSMGETPSVPEMGVIEMMNEQAAAADAARAAANEAKEAAELAQAKAETAQRKAENAQAEAEKAVNDAGEKADEAHSAAAEAKEHAQSANDAKNASDEHAQEAYQQFVAAEKAAVNAQKARDDAKIAETNAEAFSGESKRHAMTAKDYAEDAADSESMAKVHADAAKEAAENATNGVFIVKYDGSGFDKTYREIEDAARSGKSPVVVHARAGTIYTYGTLDASNRRYFDSFEYDRDGMLFNSCLRISPDNTVAIVSRGVVKTPTTKKLNFTGAATGEFDGSESVSIEIPDGGNDEIIIIHTANGTTDKTYNEISTAITKGKTAVMIDTIMGKVFPYTHSSANGYVFSNVYRNPDGKLINFAYTLKPNNTVAQNATNNVLTPNPKKITFTGAVDAEYDGSSDVTVEIPEGGTGGGGGSSADQVRADWNENDTESKAYVQNRTHWKDIETKEIYSSIQFAPMSEDEPIAMIADTPAYFPSAGDGVVVNWNGAEYACTLSDMNLGGISCVACGNLGMLMEGAEVTNEPFAMLLITPESVETAGFAAATYILDGSADVTMTMHGVLETYHKLDYRYVGTKYEQPAWGSKSGGETILDTTLTGDPQEMPIMDKFSLVEGKEYIVHWNGAEYKCAARNMQGEITMTGIGNLGVIEGGTDNGEPFVIVALPDGAADEAGYYGAAFALDGAETVSVKIVEEGETVHRIPSKFIGDYEQPAWGKVDGAGVIYQAAEGTIQTLQSYKQYAITVPVNIEVGKKYNVRFNGVDYEAVASSQTIGLETRPVIGDIGLVEASATEGDPPFLVVCGTTPFPQFEDGSVYAILNTVKGTGLEELVISEFNGIEKIPMEYLGGGAGTHGVVENEIVYLDVDLSEFAGKTIAAVKDDFSEPLIPGEEYVVDWGGTEYRGIAQTTLDGGVMIGNGRNEGWGNTEEPYAIKTVVPSDYLYDEGYKIVITMSSGATVVDHVKVCRPVGFVKKLDVEYIPRQCCTTLLMTITSLDGGNEGTPTYEANILAKEAADLFNKGMLASAAVKFVDGRIYTAERVKATSPNEPSKELNFYFTVSGQRYEVTYRSSGISVSKRPNEMIILGSTTSGSTKQFGITVDDFGTLSVTEIKE